MAAIMGTLWGMSISIAALLFYIDNYYEGYVSKTHRDLLKGLLFATALPLGIIHYVFDLPMLLGFLKCMAIAIV